MPDYGDVIALTAIDPEGDLACDFTIASEKRREGLTESLEAGILRPVLRIDGGVEARFAPSAAPAVRRYIEMESQCCSFLNLTASLRRRRHRPARHRAAGGSDRH